MSANWFYSHSSAREHSVAAVVVLVVFGQEQLRVYHKGSRTLHLVYSLLHNSDTIEKSLTYTIQSLF